MTTIKRLDELAQGDRVTHFINSTTGARTRFGRGYVVESVYISPSFCFVQTQLPTRERLVVRSHWLFAIEQPQNT